MVTHNDKFTSTPGPLVHSLPLFKELNLTTIFDIFRLQVGLIMFENVNDIGPKLIQLTPISQFHSKNTKYANTGNFHVNYVRTTLYGENTLKNAGIKLWNTIPTTIKNCKSRNSFRYKYKKLLISVYA